MVIEATYEQTGVHKVPPISVADAMMVDMKHVSTKQGFTLIELLVVITIIGILLSILSVNFGSAKTDAKNKSLMTELKETQLAIELYKSQNGEYPSAFSNGSIGCKTTLGGIEIAWSSACGTDDVIPALTPDFVASLPAASASANSNCDIQYQVDTAHTWYKLTAAHCVGGVTSSADGVQPTDRLARCSSTCSATGVCNPASADFYESYAVYSAGGECIQ